MTSNLIIRNNVTLPSLTLPLFLVHSQHNSFSSLRAFLFIYLFIYFLLSRVITRFYEYRATLCARCYFNLSPSMCFLNKFNFGFFVWIVVTFTSYDETSFACLNCKALGFENLRLVGYGASKNITAQVKNGYFLTYLLSQTALILHKPITWSLNPYYEWGVEGVRLVLKNAISRLLSLFLLSFEQHWPVRNL